MSRADGKEIGQVSQENAVPAGSLDGKWGDTAYDVATAAVGGIVELFQASQGRRLLTLRPGKSSGIGIYISMANLLNAPPLGARDRFALPAIAAESVMKILACNSNRPLAEAISAYLTTPLTDASVRRFSDMEVFVEIHENVRGEDVFVIQSTSYPANDNLMELLVTLDALRRSSARRATAVIPYYGYARQDRKTASRSPISAKLVANMITTAGADRVLTLDLHAGQIQGFFDIPTDNLFAQPVFAKDIKERYNGDDLVIVSPDVGGVVRARVDRAAPRPSISPSSTSGASAPAFPR